MSEECRDDGRGNNGRLDGEDAGRNGSERTGATVGPRAAARMRVAVLVLETVAVSNVIVGATVLIGLLGGVGVELSLVVAGLVVATWVVIQCLAAGPR